MSRRIYFLFALAMLITDVTVINGAIFAAYYIRFLSGWMSYSEFHPWRAYLDLHIIQTAILPALFAFRGMYRFRRNPSRLDELQAIFVTVAVGTVVTMGMSAFLYRDLDYSRALLSLVWMITVLLLWLSRMVHYWFQALLLRWGAAEERVLIVGTGEMAQIIYDKIRRSPSLGYRAVGFAGRPHSANREQAPPLLASLSNISGLVEHHNITEVIIAEPSLNHRQIMDIVQQCDRNRVSVKVFPDVFQIISSEAAIGDLDGMPLVSIRDARLRGWNLAIKRAMDLVISITALIALSPLLLLTALLIKLTSPKGPVFYVQERVGLDGKPFKVLKFRSMRPDAESRTGPVWATKGDPRTTPVGRIIRRFSIDELPQLVNVLIGEMSVVGPRPERPHFVEQFSRRVPRYLERHQEKAGLTGWAQVNGLRGNVSIEERTAYDLWYVENWTPWLDVKIILRTIISVLKDENAY